MTTRPSETETKSETASDEPPAVPRPLRNRFVHVQGRQRNRTENCLRETSLDFSIEGPNYASLQVNFDGSLLPLRRQQREAAPCIEKTTSIVPCKQEPVLCKPCEGALVPYKKPQVMESTLTQDSPNDHLFGAFRHLVKTLPAFEESSTHPVPMFTLSGHAGWRSVREYPCLTDQPSRKELLFSPVQERGILSLRPILDRETIPADQRGLDGLLSHPSIYQFQSTDRSVPLPEQLKLGSGGTHLMSPAVQVDTGRSYQREYNQSENRTPFTKREGMLVYQVFTRHSPTSGKRKQWGKYCDFSSTPGADSLQEQLVQIGRFAQYQVEDAAAETVFSGDNATQKVSLGWVEVPSRSDVMDAVCQTSPEDVDSSDSGVPCAQREAERASVDHVSSEDSTENGKLDSEDSLVPCPLLAARDSLATLDSASGSQPKRTLSDGDESVVPLAEEINESASLPATSNEVDDSSCPTIKFNPTHFKNDDLDAAVEVNSKHHERSPRSSEMGDSETTGDYDEDSTWESLLDLCSTETDDENSCTLSSESDTSESDNESNNHVGQLPTVSSGFGEPSLKDEPPESSDRETEPREPSLDETEELFLSQSPQAVLKVPGLDRGSCETARWCPVPSAIEELDSEEPYALTQSLNLRRAVSKESLVVDEDGGFCDASPEGTIVGGPAKLVEYSQGSSEDERADDRRSPSPMELGRDDFVNYGSDAPPEFRDGEKENSPGAEKKDYKKVMEIFFSEDSRQFMVVPTTSNTQVAVPVPRAEAPKPAVARANLAQLCRFEALNEPELSDTGVGRKRRPVANDEDCSDASLYLDQDDEGGPKKKFPRIGLSRQYRGSTLHPTWKGPPSNIL